MSLKLHEKRTRKLSMLENFKLIFVIFLGERNLHRPGVAEQKEEEGRGVGVAPLPAAVRILVLTL